MNTAKKIIQNLIAIAFKTVPRNRHLWVTGKTVQWDFRNAPPAFFDNSKYFFLYLHNKTDEKVYWLSSSREEIKILKDMDLPVVRYPSLKGVWLVLRAKFSFHHYGTDTINYIYQKGSIQLDFDHGLPLKKTEYYRYQRTGGKMEAFHDWMRKGGERYGFSTSAFFTDNGLTEQYRLDKEHILDFGYPRMDILGLSKEENMEFCRKYSRNLIEYIEAAGRYDKVLLYMPTFRDADYDFFDKADIDLDRLSDELRKINAVLFIKLHPLTKHNRIESKDNIIQISNDVDIYPFLMHTTHLIVDYSTVYYEYLMLDKEIIFIPYDYDEYVQHRSLIFDYDKITPGAKYYSFNDFISSLHDIDKLDHSLERSKLKELIIDDYDFDACERTYGYLKERYIDP